MFPSLSDFIKIPAAVLAGAVIASLVLVLRYEGVSLPLIGPVIKGRVAHAEDAAREGYVQIAEKTALEAKLKEAERQRNDAAQALEEHRRRLDAAQRLDEQQTEEREREILAYEVRLSQAHRQCLLDGDDLDFLRRP